MNDPIRILIADDHQLVRQGFKALLSVKEGVEIVGQAADGDEKQDDDGQHGNQSRRGETRPSLAAVRRRWRGWGDIVLVGVGRA